MNDKTVEEILKELESTEAYTIAQNTFKKVYKDVCGYWVFSDFESGDELDICTDYSYQNSLMTDMWTFRDGLAILKTRFTDYYYVSKVHNNEELPLKYIVIGIHLGNVPSIRLEVAKTPEEKRLLDLDINAIPLSDLNNKDEEWIMKSYCT